MRGGGKFYIKMWGAVDHTRDAVDTVTKMLTLGIRVGIIDTDTMSHNINNLLHGAQRFYDPAMYTSYFIDRASTLY